MTAKEAMARFGKVMTVEGNWSDRPDDKIIDETNAASFGSAFDRAVKAVEQYGRGQQKEPEQTLAFRRRIVVD